MVGYCEVLGWLAARYGESVLPVEFYRDIFPEGELDVKDGFTKGKYVGIIVEVTAKKKTNGRPKINRYTVTDDLEVIKTVTGSDNFCLMSPLSYVGRSRSSENARMLYAIAIDLDYIRMKDGKPVGLDNLESQIEKAKVLPRPTFIVSSGTGVHLYYVLDAPVALFRQTAEKLQFLKRELTLRIWNQYVVEIKDKCEIQQEGIFQGFRMPGTITKNGQRTVAFRSGEKVTLDYLKSFFPSEKQQKMLTLSEAKKKYPEWYERRVIKKEPRGVWHVSRNLYDWWLRQIRDGAVVGHRYYCMMTLAMYARKCSMFDEKHNPNPVTEEDLKKDCFELMPLFDALTVEETNHFDEGDVMDALEAFNDRWITYPRSAIEYRSGIKIPVNKRNGRNRTTHIRLVNAQRIYERDLLHENPYKNNGRPTKEQLVQEWKHEHPSGTVTDAARDLGISRTTVYRWWTL